MRPSTQKIAALRKMYKKALDIVLARKVSPKELKAFLKEGKIGEYAQVQGAKNENLLTLVH